jgi:deoxyuridine 5'-triphosphate nucleotidohydrolase
VSSASSASAVFDNPVARVDEEVQPIYVKKLSPHAFVPKRGSEEAAGADLCACLTADQPRFAIRSSVVTAYESAWTKRYPDEFTSLKPVDADTGKVFNLEAKTLDTFYEVERQGTILFPGDRALVPTQLSMALPKHTYQRIADRSGLTWNRGGRVGAGVADADFRGMYMVVLFNCGNGPLKISHGDAIAQAIPERITPSRYVEVDSLEETVRCAGGFGSTGVSRLQNAQ